MRFVAALAVFMALPAATSAQDVDAVETQAPAAVLVADQVFITQDRTLVAQGNVEAFQGTSRIRAKSIRYNQQTGALTIEGPIVLSQGDETVILADAAELERDLQNGLLTGARLILNQQLQLTSVQLDRVDGRYSQLYKTAVTSCKVCEDGEAPLWQIRAKRVIHDEQERQLYFDQAQFRIKNVPVFYLPRLRLPDPTLDRSSGFLTPSIRTTSQFSTGIKIPYFIKFGDTRDLTVTPYLSSRTTTLELRYRQAFKTGRIEFNGALSKDDERPDDTRAYLFGVGDFDLARDYKLHFEIEATGDRAYLTEYGYSNKDRLTSELTVSRARRDEYVRASIFNFESLRDADDNDTLPTFVLDGEYERRIFPTALGGEIRFGLEAHSHRRSSSLNTDGPDADLISDGLDVARINGEVDWLRRMTLRSGLVTDVRAGVNFGFFNIEQDVNTPEQNHTDFVPHAAVALRYPMVRRGNNGVVQTLEPLVQIGWTDGDRLSIPNDESTRVEFDQGNLLAMSRFPSPDRIERGGIAAVGVNWSRVDPTGWDAHLTLGQVFRETADTDITETSGLDSTTSNFLLAGQINTINGVSLTGRGLFDTDFKFAKAEVRGDWNFNKGRLGGSYVWLTEDLAEDRPQEISEISLDGSYAINSSWIASADYRFDVADDRAATAGFGLTYNNECVTVDLSVNRRYSSSTSVEPSTNFGFNVGLRGFAASSEKERYVRSCRK
jgi:LPS-assembly protein